MLLVHDRRSVERSGLDLSDLLNDPQTRVLPVIGDRALIDDSPGELAPQLVVRSPQPDDVDAQLILFLGRDIDGHAVVAVMNPEPTQDDDAQPLPTPTQTSRVGAEKGPEAESPGRSWQTLREVGPWLSDAAAFMTAQGMSVWHRTHRFCPRCGAPTEPRAAGWVRRCTVEERELYPRTDPAVIMAVVDEDDRILLGRSPAWPEDRRSVLAGFVEPGESLEDAVRREVGEEVGLQIGDVTYEGSQPWPFPASLMVGFVARAQTVDVQCDPSEMAQAEWYDRAELRAAVADGHIALPGRMSIARKLIEHWLGSAIVVPGVDERGGPAWGARS